MQQPVEDPFLITYQTLVMLASFGVCILLVGLRFRGPWLRFQPRKLVPWNAAGALLAIMLVSFAVLSSLAPHDDAEKSAKAEQEQSASQPDDTAKSQPDDSAYADFRIAAAIAEQVVFVGGMLFLFVAYFSATWKDFGLPANVHELCKDILIGIVAALAVLAPVFIVMLIVTGPEVKSGHPLVKMLSEGKPDITVFIVSSLAAVVVAPICEEFMFRVMLQGWLEKCEARWREIVRPVSADDLQLPNEDQLSSPPVVTDFEAHSLENEASLDHPTAHELAPSEAAETIIDKSHGWLAIIISAACFGLAHLGYGPEPIPLFFLALVLGYLYNRTHRVVPSIVAHALFNAFTMITLWRIVFYGHANLQ